MSEANEQQIANFFKILHIDLSVAIERRESFDATTERDAIAAQDIDFFDVSIDEKSDENTEEIDDTLSERSRTTSDVEIEKDKSFDDEKDDEAEEVKNETIDFEICKKNETTVFDFFA